MVRVSGLIWSQLILAVMVTMSVVEYDKCMGTACFGPCGFTVEYDKCMGTATKPYTFESW